MEVYLILLSIKNQEMNLQLLGELLKMIENFNL